MSYVPLRVRTTYSLGRGASKVESVIARAAEINALATPAGQEPEIAACGLADLVSLSAAYAFSSKGLAAGVQPIIGCNFILQSVSGETRTKIKGEVTGDILVYAIDREGFAAISRMLTKAYQPTVARRGPKGRMEILDIPLLDFDDETAELLRKPVIILTGNGEKGFAAASLRRDRGVQLGKLVDLAGDRLYIEICRSLGRGSAPGGRDPDEDRLLAYAAGEGRRYPLPIVATTDCWYATDADAASYEIMVASRKERHAVSLDWDAWQKAADLPLEKRPILLSPLDEAVPMRMPTADEFRALFADLPRSAISNTCEIRDRSGFVIEKVGQVPPKFRCENGATEDWTLRTQAKAGLDDYIVRYGLQDQAAIYSSRLDMELEVIANKKFSGYFLIVSGFIVWAKDKGISVGDGRGSGAGSLVAWVMKITNVDPIKYGLLFERFLNPERQSMPDFDVDFDPTRRDEVIDYVRGQYTPEAAKDVFVCAIGAFGGIKPKSAIDLAWTYTHMIDAQGRRMAISMDDKRALSSVLGDTKPGEDSFAKILKSERVGDRYRAALKRQGAAVLHRVGLGLEGLLRNQTRHAAGIVISSEPLSPFLPTIVDRSDLSTPLSCFDMKGVEDVGAVKFDFLGLNNLSVINSTLKMLKIDGMDVVIDETLSDKAVYRTIRSGMTEGIFQFGGGGMINALQQARPDCFTDISAITAVYRPGPMKFLPSFAARKRGHEAITYPLAEYCRLEAMPVGDLDAALAAVGDALPADMRARLSALGDKTRMKVGDGLVLAAALRAAGLPTEPGGERVGDRVRALLVETYGYMVYQEQVMAVAQLAAGYSLGRADTLRRAMGKKDQATMAAERQGFVDGCLANGIDREDAEALFGDIQQFAEYGFNKSHAVAYSVISYRTAWLKTYYPDYFYAALLLEKQGNQEGVRKIMSEMIRYGVGFELPDVNRSHEEARPSGGRGAGGGGYWLLCGLTGIAGISDGAARLIFKERDRAGPYRSVVDFWQRTRGDVTGMSASGDAARLQPVNGDSGQRAGEADDQEGAVDRTGWRQVLKTRVLGLGALQYEALVAAGALDNLPINDGDPPPDPGRPACRQKIALVLKWLAENGRGNRRQQDIFSGLTEGGIVMPRTFLVPSPFGGKAADATPIDEIPDYRDRAKREFLKVGFSAAASYMLTQAPRLINAGFRTMSGLDHVLTTTRVQSIDGARFVLRVMGQERNAADILKRRGNGRETVFCCSDGEATLYVVSPQHTAEMRAALSSGRPVAVFGNYRREFIRGVGRTLLITAEVVIDAERYLSGTNPSPDIVIQMTSAGNTAHEAQRAAILLANDLIARRRTSNPFGGQVVLVAGSEDAGGLIQGIGDRDWRITSSVPDKVWPVTESTCFDTKRANALLFDIDDALIAELEARADVARVILPAAANMRCALGHPVYMDTATLSGLAASEIAWEARTGEFYNGMEGVLALTPRRKLEDA